MKINTQEDMIYAGSILINKGAKNVLIKGGHLKSRFVRDVLINKKEIKIFKNKRIESKNTHGTGCTLSSAITTYLACGKTINKACELGIKYVNQAIGSNMNYGEGHGPINHLTSVSLNKGFK
jgi:hydroxymethylpyrimidine kinase/phosphomethylpyrimidine kinase